jgi:5-methylcytosine-specific restriction endonuclease McrA
MKPAVKIFPDGREVCQDSAAGKREYYRRADEVWERYGKCCWLCGKSLDRGAMAVDHIRPKGTNSAWRDDRAFNIAPACYPCNSRRGSRRMAEYPTKCPECGWGAIVGHKEDKECFHCTARWRE